MIRNKEVSGETSKEDCRLVGKGRERRNIEKDEREMWAKKKRSKQLKINVAHSYKMQAERKEWILRTQRNNVLANYTEHV